MNLSVLAQTATPQPAGAYGWFTIIMMVVLLLAFYFILIRPQRKKEKKDAEMRKNLQIGDEIVTVGGIVGIVCKIEEETLVIETGGDRSRLRIKKWAVSQNLDAEKEAAAATAAAKAEKMGKKVPDEKGIEKKD
jgi:preprotein translocase, yajC subunit